jgi:dihydrofolate reductase
MGHAVLMGRKTYESIGRPLPGRRNIVVTRNAGWGHDGVDVVHSLADAVALVGNDSASIIGGAQIFAEAMHVADRLVVTHIDKAYRCDTFFPEIDSAQWAAVSNEPLHSPTAGVDYAIVTYDRVR